MAKIILMADGAVLQEMTLSKERITIGRRPGNDIVIDNLAISGQHAAITTIADDSFLEDLGSTNGTLVNGQPVKKHFLQNGDVIELAKYRIQYQAAPRRESGIASAAADALSTLTQNTQPYNPAQMYDDGVRQGSIKITSGASNGKEMRLTKALTTIGRPGIAVAAITRNPQGFAITHIEGDSHPVVNGQSIGAATHALRDGDMLDIAGTTMQFNLG
ncbi:FHA domain-containing protein [Herminiimonas sp. CN]|uniref:FHA domain-containing protein n=1 Tax=Herminiimonas sp. CN TaxID=1349818 RepID=UPI0004735A3B|nr:FHA domain-containing protein [Herminiimonas sp. CN]